MYLGKTMFCCYWLNTDFQKTKMTTIFGQKLEITTNVYLFHALTWAAAEISLKEKPPAAAVLNWLLLLWHEFGTCSAISGNFGELTF